MSMSKRTLELNTPSNSSLSAPSTLMIGAISFNRSNTATFSYKGEDSVINSYHRKNIEVLIHTVVYLYQFKEKETEDTWSKFFIQLNQHDVHPGMHSQCAEIVDIEDNEVKISFSYKLDRKIHNKGEYEHYCDVLKSDGYLSRQEGNVIGGIYLIKIIDNSIDHA